MAANSFDKIRALLVQVRNTEDIEVQEQQCFLERTQLHPEQLHCINLARSELHADLSEDYDVLFIGGAGEYSAVEDYDWMPSALSLIRDAADLSFPVFGSCWGHQLIARALGGTVVRDLARAELGCLPVYLTEQGKVDPLFASYPARFYANMGHHDRVTHLPHGSIELATGSDQPNEAFRIEGKPIYGTQFHSELNATREEERLLRYRPYYRDELPDDDVFDRVVRSLKETTEVDHLMYDFLLKFVVRQDERRQ